MHLQPDLYATPYTTDSDAGEHQTLDLPWLTDNTLQWTLLNSNPTVQSSYNGLQNASTGDAVHASDSSYSAFHSADRLAVHSFGDASTLSSPFAGIQSKDATHLRHSVPNTQQHPFYPFSAHQPSSTVSIDPGEPGTNKRPRICLPINNATGVQLSPMQLAPYSLATAVQNDHALSGIREWVCTESNCFMMDFLDQKPLDHFNKPFSFNCFSAHVVDSDPLQKPAASEFLPLKGEGEAQKSKFTISRPSGRTLHLLITVLPRVPDTKALETGFALIIACLRVQEGTWRPACLAKFKDTANSVARTRYREVAFLANLEHCREANGRRIWGQRTSHVRHDANEPLKAVRLEPKGPLGVRTEEEVCFFVVLFDANGVVLRHVDGTPCIAQTNAVRYKPKRSPKGASKEGTQVKIEDGMRCAVEEVTKNTTAELLARELGKVTLWDQISAMSWPQAVDDLRSRVAKKDPSVLKRVGVSVLDDAKARPTAVALSLFQTDADTQDTVNGRGKMEDFFAARIRAVAHSIGWHHADAEMTHPTLEAPQCAGIRSAGEWCAKVVKEGAEEAAAWLRLVGVGPELDTWKPMLRASTIGSILQKRKFRASRTICIGNPCPDRILVDSVDSSKVYCLATSTQEADVAMQDRMQPLAYLAHYVDADRQAMRDLFFAPYIEGFRSRKTIAVDEPANDDGQPASTSFVSPYALHPVDGPLVDEEKFYLLLHVIRLDKFVHYTHLRDAPSVRRLYRQLLEEDRTFDAWYYTPGHFVRFEA